MRKRDWRNRARIRSIRASLRRGTVNDGPKPEKPTPSPAVSQSREALAARLVAEVKTEAAVMDMIDDAIINHINMVRKAKAAEPGWEESDFNRGYFACLTDVKRKLQGKE